MSRQLLSVLGSVFGAVLLATAAMAEARSTLAYVTNTGGNTISLIDTDTQAVVGVITVGSAPAGIATLPDGTRVYVANSGSNTVSVIDSVTKVVVATIAVGIAPAAVAVAPDGSKVYIANTGSDSVSVISTASKTVIATIPMGALTFVSIYPPGAQGIPYSHLAVTPDGSRVYVTNTFPFNQPLSSSLKVISTATNAVVGTVQLTSRNSGSVELAPNGTVGYVSGWYGYFQSFKVATNMQTQAFTLSGGGSGISLAGIAALPNSSLVYAAASEHNSVYVIDPGAQTWTAIGVGKYPTDVSIAPDGTTVYVVNRGTSTVSIIDTTTNTVVATVPVGTHPSEVAFVVDEDAPPIAHAGADFSVDEGHPSVVLNGSGSQDPNGDPLTYSWVQLPGGTPVTLFDALTAHPTFTGPFVASGGETLSFALTVTANGETSTDAVSVTIVNVNHTPVADAGEDQSVAEGSPVVLHGEASFDPDGDETQPTFTYTWVQVDGSPTVALTGAGTKHPSFTAPYVVSGGAPGVVATLVFELRVDDGFTPDAPAPGFTFANVVDRVTIAITNVNNLPTADAGRDQTVNENSAVTLNAAGSNDPDSDTLSYAWAQVAGPTVSLINAASVGPSFTAPYIGPGGADLMFEVTVDDGYGGLSADAVVIHVQNVNDPPLATAARPTVAVLWPANHGLVTVGITGVSDPNGNATITITGVTQDEPTNGTGEGDTPIDAFINVDGTVLLRAERAGNGNGRVYRIAFTASDPEGSTSGVVVVAVPHSPKNPAIDSGQAFNSTQ